MQSEFVNLRIRQLSAETSHDFIEWCGLLEGQEENQKIAEGIKIYRNEVYFDFVNEYPDYGQRAKYSISRTKFYRWLVSYCIFKEGIPPEEGRDSTGGRWIIIKQQEKQKELEF